MFQSAIKTHDKQLKATQKDEEQAAGDTNCISHKELCVSLHLESVGHELDKTNIGISTDGHQESNSDVQIGQQVTNIQQLLTKVLLNCCLVHYRLLTKQNKTTHKYQFFPTNKTKNKNMT